MKHEFATGSERQEQSNTCNKEGVLAYLETAKEKDLNEILNAIHELSSRQATKDHEANNFLGRGITGNDAVAMTKKYYGEDATKIPSLFKSVYFDLDEAFFGFLNHIRALGSTNNGRPGFRVYIARSLESQSPTVTHDFTVILRGTRNHEDLPHNETDEANGRFVAFNYGDPCPPRCKPGQNPDEEVCLGGQYTLSGGLYPDLVCTENLE